MLQMLQGMTGWLVLCWTHDLNIDLKVVAIVIVSKVLGSLSVHTSDGMSMGSILETVRYKDYRSCVDILSAASIARPTGPPPTVTTS